LASVCLAGLIAEIGLIPPSPSASAGNALKGLSGSAHKKSPIVKADRDPAIVAALDYFPNFASQRHLRSPGERLSDQPDMIANFETGFQLRILLHFPFAFSLNHFSGSPIV
jgi:hypothetical protein